MRPLVTINAHSQDYCQSLAGYCAIATPPNPIYAVLGYANSENCSSCRMPVPLKIMAVNSFDKPENPAEYPIGGRDNIPLRFYSMGMISTNMMLDAANELRSFREVIRGFNDLIGKFAEKNGAILGPDHSWGASLAAAELTEDSMTLLRLGNSLSIVETDEVIVNLNVEGCYYLDGQIDAVDRIEWDTLPLDEVKRMAFLVSQAPIQPFMTPLMPDNAIFGESIRRKWKNHGPQKAIEYVLSEQKVDTDYVIIHLDCVN